MHETQCGLATNRHQLGRGPSLVGGGALSSKAALGRDFQRTGCWGLQARVCHRAFGGGVDEFGVFGQDAFGVAGFGLFPLGEA